MPTIVESEHNRFEAIANCARGFENGFDEIGIIHRLLQFREFRQVRPQHIGSVINGMTLPARHRLLMKHDSPPPGIAELVGHGEHGYLVPAGHTEQLAERITALLSQPAVRQRMGVAGRAKVQSEFDVSVAATQLHDLFAAAAQEGSHGR